MTPLPIQDDHESFERALLIAALSRMCGAHGMEAGTSRDGVEPDLFFYVTLQLEHAGQVSWRLPLIVLPFFAFLPPFEHTKDGHGPIEQMKRLTTFSSSYQKP